MADSIIEQIALNVVTTLQGITIANNYTRDVSQVVRPHPGVGDARQDMQIIVAQGNPSVIEDRPQQHKQWRQPFAAICCVQELKASTTSIESRQNSIRADVEKILMVDFHRGGLAINTVITDPLYADTDAGANEGIVAVNFDVIYRTLLQDPYSQ